MKRKPKTSWNAWIGIKDGKPYTYKTIEGRQFEVFTSKQAAARTFKCIAKVEMKIVPTESTQ